MRWRFAATQGTLSPTGRLAARCFGGCRCELLCGRERRSSSAGGRGEAPCGSRAGGGGRSRLVRGLVGPDGPRGRAGTSRSDLNLDELLAGLGGDGLALLTKHVEVSFDGLADVGDRLVVGVPLAHAAGERRHGHDETAVRVLLQDDRVLHDSLNSLHHSARRSVTSRFAVISSPAGFTPGRGAALPLGKRYPG